MHFKRCQVGAIVYKSLKGANTPAYFTPSITMKEISLNLMGFTLRRSELEIRSDIIAQQVF